MQRRNARPGLRSAALAALTLLAAGCAASSHSSGHPAASQGQTHTAATAAAAVTITPANGTRHADPSAGITVTATRGTLGRVSVRSRGGAVPGELSDGGKVWHSQWALDVSQTLT